MHSLNRSFHPGALLLHLMLKKHLHTLGMPTLAHNACGIIGQPANAPKSSTLYDLHQAKQSSAERSGSNCAAYTHGSESPQKANRG